MANALPDDLPPRIVDRLRGEGVETLESWVALGRRRLQIFGVTRSTVASLDAHAKAVLRQKAKLQA